VTPVNPRHGYGASLSDTVCIRGILRSFDYAAIVMRYSNLLNRMSACATSKASLWWLLVVVLAGLIALLSQSAAGQSERGDEIIVQALALKPNLDAGRRLYEDRCVSCHGDQGWGNVSEVIPALAGQLSIYVIKQLVDISEAQRIAPEMHRIIATKEMTRTQSLRDVAGYIETLTPNSAPELGDGKQLDVGKRYYEGLCAFCHGEQGGGNESHATPALRRQNYSYLLMQMRSLSAGHRYSVDIEISNSLAQLQFEKLQAIADYVARLPAAGRSSQPANNAVSEKR